MLGDIPGDPGHLQLGSDQCSRGLGGDQQPQPGRVLRHADRGELPRVLGQGLRNVGGHTAGARGRRLEIEQRRPRIPHRLLGIQRGVPCLRRAQLLRVVHER